MPWQECSKVDERLRFVARLLEGERMTDLCREFDISRKTGYKIFTRYQLSGLEGLTDRSRRPYRQANRLPELLESRIVQLRRDHPTWGAPKIREKLKRQTWALPYRRSAPCTQSSIAMGSSAAVGAAHTTRQKVRCSLAQLVPMRFGALTTRASSCSPIGVTAIR